jgi:hypothetical protein
MMVAVSRVRVGACCGVLALLALCGTAPADSLASAPFPAPTMGLPHHLA